MLERSNSEHKLKLQRYGPASTQLKVRIRLKGEHVKEVEVVMEVIILVLAVIVTVVIFVVVIVVVAPTITWGIRANLLAELVQAY